MIGFGARLKAARKIKKLTQKDIAQQLNLHRTAYTKYECDIAEPTLETLAKLTVILDVSADSLLTPQQACPFPSRS